jgi:hypothetical protein
VNTPQTGAGRLAPLLGTLTAVLMLVGTFALGGNTPDTEDGAGKVLRYYTEHSSQQELAAYLVALAGVALLLFGAPLRERLNAAGGTRSAWLPVVTAALAVTSAGMLITAGTHFALGQETKHLSAQGAATLNSIDGAGFFAVFGGLAVLLTATTLVTWRTRGLPRAFLVLAPAIALITISPIGYIGGLLAILWIGALGVYLAVRPVPSREPAATAPAYAA